MSIVKTIMRSITKGFEALGGKQPGHMIGTPLRFGLSYLLGFVLIYAGWTAYERVEWEIFRMKNKDAVVEARALIQAKTGGEDPDFMDREEIEAFGAYDDSEWNDRVRPAWYMIEKYDRSPHRYSPRKTAAGGFAILFSAFLVFFWEGRLRRRTWAEEDEMLRRYKLEKNRRV